MVLVAASRPIYAPFSMNLLFRERGKILKNSNLIRYSMQLSFLKQLLDKKLITDKEYSLNQKSPDERL